MATNPLKGQAPKLQRSAIGWLLDSDPSIRWQVMRDLKGKRSTMKIQQVSAKTGLSIHTLRYYEQTGLVAPIARATNGHRAYTEDDVYRILFVTHLRTAGMPIADIRR